MQASTGFTPFMLDTGQHPIVPHLLGVHNNSQHTDVSTVQGVVDMISSMQKSLHTAQQHLQMAQARQKKYADRERRDHEFQVGDQVLLSTAHLNIASHGPAAKLNAKFIGPFNVAEIVSPVALRLELPAHVRTHPVVHASRVRLYHDGSEKFPLRKPPPPPPTVNVKGKDEYEVDAILDARGRGKQRKWLVRFKGYDAAHDEWLPLDNLKNCPEKMAEFERLQKLRAKGGRKDS